MSGSAITSRSAFCFALEKRGQFRLGLTYFEVTCSGRVSSGWGYCTLLTFLRHLLFTQLQFPRVMQGIMVSIVSKHERIPEWMCFSEKVSQPLVVSFTIDKMSGIIFKNDLFYLT